MKIVISLGGQQKMFERYTEKARRVIFFARYEASQFGQPYIETEHILLGLLREDKALTNRFLRTLGAVESVRRQIEKHVAIREKISTSVDLPLSNESKRVLAHAAEEAERLGHKHIGTEHLLLGLLREENSFAAEILKGRGIELTGVREDLAKVSMEKDVSGIRERSGASSDLAALYTDLTQKAAEGALQPVAARDQELEAVIEVLCRKVRRNPILLGERGAGKTAIVEALAQRMADGKVPPALSGKRILAVSTEALSARAPDREKFEDLAKALGAAANPSDLILFIDGLHEIVDASRKNAGQALRGVLQFALHEAEVRCIGATTEEEYKAACAIYPGLDKVFRPLHVKPLGVDGALAVLRARKQNLEHFHAVTFAEEALDCAVQRADSYLAEKLLPGKALELLDAAGAAVNARQEAEPIDISEARKKIAFITIRMDSAIQAHEFEKAKFYSEEERKERATLRELLKMHGPDDTVAATVTREDVEQIIAKWNAYPYSQ